MIIPSTVFYLKEGLPAEIRSFQECEGAYLVGLRRELCRESDYYDYLAEQCPNFTAVSQMNYISHYNRGINSILLGCFVQGCPVGIATLEFYGDERENHICELSFAVLEKYRRQGIATEFIKNALALASIHKTALVLECVVIEGNRAALKLLKKNGFHKFGESRKAVHMPDNKFYSKYLFARKIRREARLCLGTWT